jgi:hypothetical protein
MHNDLTIANQTTTSIITTDGWADAAADAADQIVHGALLRFGDGLWTVGREGTEVAKGTRLMAIGTAHCWQHWQDGRPGRVILRRPGESLPERDTLGDEDENLWPVGPDGKTRRDPWQNTRLVYLFDPRTAEAFTYSTTTWSGRGVVIELGDQIQRKRFTMPSAVPLIELGSAPLMTKFGRKSKPMLKVIEWHDGVDGDNGAARKPAVPDDEIPF